MSDTSNFVRSPSRVSLDSAGVQYMRRNYAASDVIGQGYLTKIGQRWKSHKRRWFVITFQHVRYYENRDKYEANANPLGTISVGDIQSIQSSNALNFGENTSLSIRTKNRTLEVGDRKELVADSVLFVLQRWLALRNSQNDPSLVPSLAIPVIEMPSTLQREVQRAFEESPIESYIDLMQEPSFLFSWTAEARIQIVADYAALFEVIFGSDPSKSQEHLSKYILLHDTWTAEIIVYLTNAGKIRRLCADPEPLIHYLSDHFASISKIDLQCFDEVKGIPALIACLKRLADDYKFILHELILPTRLKTLEEVSSLLNQLQTAIPCISFDDSSLKLSSKELQTNGYLLHLHANPPTSHNSTLTTRLSTDLEFSIPSSMQTMDAGFITTALANQNSFLVHPSLHHTSSSPSEPEFPTPSSLLTMDSGFITSAVPNMDMDTAHHIAPVLDAPSPSEPEFPTPSMDSGFITSAMAALDIPTSNPTTSPYPVLEGPVPPQDVSHPESTDSL